MGNLHPLAENAPVKFSFNMKNDRDKISRLLTEYDEVLGKVGKLEAAYGHLVKSAKIKSSDYGVNLQEPRQGDVVTQSSGTISLSGHSNSAGIGVGLGPIGVGIGRTSTNLNGTTDSTSYAVTQSDSAKTIDTGCFTLSDKTIVYVGSLQTRKIELANVVDVKFSFNLLKVATDNLALTQRFVFKDLVEGRLIHECLVHLIEGEKMPDGSERLAMLEKIYESHLKKRFEHFKGEVGRIAPRFVFPYPMPD